MKQIIQKCKKLEIVSRIQNDGKRNMEKQICYHIPFELFKRYVFYRKFQISIENISRIL